MHDVLKKNSVAWRVPRKDNSIIELRQREEINFFSTRVFLWIDLLIAIMKIKEISQIFEFFSSNLAGHWKCCDPAEWGNARVRNICQPCPFLTLSPARSSSLLSFMSINSKILLISHVSATPQERLSNLRSCSGQRREGTKRELAKNFQNFREDTNNEITGADLKNSNPPMNRESEGSPRNKGLLQKKRIPSFIQDRAWACSRATRQYNSCNNRYYSLLEAWCFYFCDFFSDVFFLFPQTPIVFYMFSFLCFLIFFFFYSRDYFNIDDY